MNIGNISRYRGELMGFAIIIVMLFHVNLPRSDMFFGLRRMGNLGVDIFFFLSGIGLWFSWTKQRDWVRFYKNRALRIYPVWLMVAGWFYISRFTLAHPSYKLPWGGTGVAQIDSCLDLAGDLLFNWDFWLYDELTFWYVPATMMLYLFAPPYMEMIRRHGVMRWAVVVPMMWCVAVQYITPIHSTVGHIEIFWSRVPIFFLGINAAEAVRNQREVDRQAWYLVAVGWLLSLSSCVWLEQMRHGRFPLFLERILYIPLAFTTILIMAECFRRMDGRRLLGMSPNKMLAWVGGISLEIYLVHVEFVLKPLQQYHLGYWRTFIIMTVITLPVAWLVGKVAGYIGSRLKRII